MCNNDKCINCFEKSCASHTKIKYWCTQNKLKPREVFKHGDTVITFNCERNHIFSCQIKNTTTENPTWCPYCINKTEQKLYEQLSPYYNNLKQQYKVEWCKNKTYLPFDFVLEEFKIIIELDGL